MQTNNHHLEERLDQARAVQTFWSAVGTLYRRRRFIIVTTGLVAVGAVVLSLLLPKWYLASTRLLVPESGGGGAMTAMLGDLAPVASSLLNTAGGDYNRYLSILSSRRVRERVVERFDLMAVYETEDSEAPLEQALETLAGNTELVIDNEYGFLSVEVLDQDPQRAADIANFFVEELNRVNSDLAMQNAANYRYYLEQSVRETEQALDSTRSAMQRFQEQYGVVNLDAQVQAFLESMASLRTEAIQAEIQHEVLESQYGPGHPQVEMAARAQQAANRKVNEALAGSEQLMPVPQGMMPAVARQYGELMQEMLIQAEILKFIRPVYEQARLDEQREKTAVQVLDLAVPPARKAKPKRMIIVILATLSAFLLAVIYVLAYEWMRRHARYLHRRLQEAEHTPERQEAEQAARL